MPRNGTGDDPYYWNSPYWDDQYSTWDTYHSLYPLKSLVDSGMMAEAANFFARCQESFGYIPRHFVAGQPSVVALGGATADPIVTEAILKRLPGVEADRCYAALLASANHNLGRRPGYLKDDRGYITIPWRRKDNRYPGAETLQGNQSDAWISLVARRRGDKANAERYAKRAQGWKYLWNPEALDEDPAIKGFVTPRYEDGRFIPVRKEKNDKIDYEYWHPKYDESQMPEWINVRQDTGGFFGEGNYWTFSLLINQDPAALIERCGGPEAFVRRLEVGFENNLMGLWNEPGFFIPHLANYAGRPDITAKWSRFAMIGRRARLTYTTKLGPRGNYGGDEDSGAMSSRWVLWSMGLFPNGGSDIWLLHGPFFTKVTLQLENGNDLIIIGENAGENNPYVQSCELNGKPWNQCWIRHEDLIKGGVLKFVMGPQPSKWAHHGVLPPSLGDFK